jgi:hypothetical protein
MFLESRVRPVLTTLLTLHSVVNLGFLVQVTELSHVSTALSSEKEPSVNIGQKTRWALEFVCMLWQEKRCPPLEFDPRVFGRATAHCSLSVPVMAYYRLHAFVV